MRLYKKPPEMMMMMVMILTTTAAAATTTTTTMMIMMMMSSLMTTERYTDVIGAGQFPAVGNSCYWTIGLLRAHACCGNRFVRCNSVRPIGWLRSCLFGTSLVGITREDQHRTLDECENQLMVVILVVPDNIFPDTASGAAV